MYYILVYCIVGYNLILYIWSKSPISKTKRKNTTTYQTIFYHAMYIRRKI